MKTNILRKTREQAVADNVMPTLGQWIELKAALQNAIAGPLTHNNLLAKASDGHDAHFIGIHPADYETLNDALLFTMNDDLEIV